MSDKVDQYIEQMEALLSGNDSGACIETPQLRQLVEAVDRNEILEPDVEHVLIQLAEDFVQNVVQASCDLASHRQSQTVEAKDVQFHLEKVWGIRIPGYTGLDELEAPPQYQSTQSHEDRVALVRKAISTSSSNKGELKKRKNMG